MSPELNFGTAAEGQIPEQGTANAVCMGRYIDVMTIAEGIGKAAQEGVARPVNMLTATTVATPSGGLDAKGHETEPYTYKGDTMFGAPTAS
jgi:hypothetical protein